MRTSFVGGALVAFALVLATGCPKKTEPTVGSPPSLDDTPPTVRWLEPPPGSTVSGLVELKAEASDDLGVDRVEFLADGVWVGVSASSPYRVGWGTDGGMNGNYWLTARAVDTSGQAAESGQWVVVDNAPSGADLLPVVAIRSPVDGSTVCGAVPIEVEAADDVGLEKVAFFVDATPVLDDTLFPYLFVWDTSGLARGLHTLKVVARDTSGQETQFQARVDVDNGVTCDRAPEIQLIGPPWLAYSIGQQTVVAMAVDDHGVAKVTFHLSQTLLGEATALPYSADWNVSTTPEGTYELWARAVDTAGKSAADAKRVVVDRTPPTVAFVAPAVNARVGETFVVELTASDNVALDQVEIGVDGTSKFTWTAAPFQTSISLAGVASGTHTLRAMATDLAGQNSEVVRTIELDRPPSVSWEAPDGGTSVRGLVTLRVNATDDLGLAGVDFYVDGTFLSKDTFAPYSAAWDTGPFADGPHTLRAEATDTANQKASVERVLVVEDQPPVVSVVPLPASVGNEVLLSATVTDDGTVGLVRFLVDGVVVSTFHQGPYQSRWNSCGAAPSVHTFTVDARDTKPQATVVNTPFTLDHDAAPLFLLGRAGDGEAVVEWRGCPVATGYKLFYSTSPGVTEQSAALPGVSSPYRHGGLNNGTTVYYRVAAVLGGTDGPLSNEVALTPLGAVCKASGFCWQNPTPQGHILHAAWAVSFSDLWVGGEKGTLMHWNGAGWADYSVQANTTFQALWAFGSSDVWAASSTGFSGHWNGSDWSVSTLPANPWNDLWGASPTDVWVAGNSYLARWNGTSWSPNLQPVNAVWSSVWGFGPTAVWASGSQGTRYFDGAQWFVGSSTRFEDLWGTSPTDVWGAGNGVMGHWNGVSWSLSYPTPQALTGIWGSSASDVWAVGSGMKLHWNGSSWTSVSAGRELRGVHSVGAEAFAVGAAGAMVSLTGGFPLPPTGSLTGSNLNAVWAAAPNDAWAVGGGGTLLRWNGSRWMQVASGSTSELTGVWGAHANDVWAAGGGALLHGNSAGWVNVPKPVGLVSAVFGSGPADVWAVGSLILHWDGESWTSLSTPPAPLNGGFSLSATEAWAAAGNGRLQHWNGSSWSEVNPGGGQAALRSVWASSATNVFAVGDASVVFRWNGGGWTQTSVTGSGAKNSVWGSGPTDVWAAGSGDVFHFDGATWSQVDRAQLPALGGLAGSGPDQLFGVGDNGAVLRYAP